MSDKLTVAEALAKAEQIDAMLGVLSGALSGLMLSHMGPWATRERFIALGEHYARLGVEKGFTQ